MGIEFEYIGKKEITMSNMHTLEERTYVTQDGSKIAGDKHKGGKILFGAAGHKIPLSRAIELGLAKSEKKEKKDDKE